MPATTAPTGIFSFESVFLDGDIDYVIDKSSFSNLITATTGAINSASVTPSTTNANDLATYTFSFVNTHEIVQDGKILIILPSQIVFPSPSKTANSCKAISGVSDSLICEATSSSMTINSGFSTGPLVSGSTISFSIDNVRSPPSIAETESFTIKTLSDDNFDIDSIDEGVTVTMVTFNNITFIEITSESLINGAATNLNFKLVSPSPLQNGDLLYITFPTQVATPSAPIICAGTTILVDIACTLESSGPDLIKVELDFGKASSIEANELLEFNIDGCKNPPTTEPSDQFSFEITDSANFTINSWAGDIRVTTTEAAELLNPSMLPNSTVALADINLIFTFTLAHGFPSTGVMYIYYPEGVGYNSSNLECQCIDLGSKDFTSTCTCEQQTVSGRNRIIFKNSFSSGLKAGSTVEITLEGLINPEKAEESNSFEILTETSQVNGYQIDKTSAGLTLTSD
jgi:hypothetical protein